MSSREIAELTQKEHKNVKRDCEVMFADLELDVLRFERIYFDSMNREQAEYVLPSDLVLTLVTGYSIKLRHAVVTRLKSLEESDRNSYVQSSSVSQSSILEIKAETEKLLNKINSLTFSGRTINAIESENSRLESKILHIVGQNGCHGMTFGVICNRLRKTPKDIVKLVLSQMVVKNLIKKSTYINKPNLRSIDCYHHVEMISI